MTSLAIRGSVLEIKLSIPVILAVPAVALAWRLYVQHRASCAPATDAADFFRSGVAVLRWLIDYRRTCGRHPIISEVAPNYLRDSLPEAAPEQPEPFTSILSDLSTKIVPGLTHWENSERFFAYFKPHSSYPAVLGELVCAGLNVMGFDWIASPACTELEVVTLDWLAKLLQLPSRFLNSSPGPGGSVIQGSAGESAIVILLAASRKAQQAAAARRSSPPPDVPDGTDVDREIDIGRDRCVVYCSDQTHAIIKKACMVLGLRCRPLTTRLEDGFRLRGTTVAAAIDADLSAGLLPVAVVGTSGTTTSCVFDPLQELADVCTARSLWLHVDAAYGGAYACLPHIQPLFAGLDRCDSFCVNAHKKMLVPFDLAALYVADRRPLLAALALTPEYLRNAPSESGAVVDYEHWQLGLGRRFRALKLWFVLRRFGASGMRAHVQRGVDLANRFGNLVVASDVLELATPVSLSLVCFRCKAEGDEMQRRLLANVKARGVFIIHSKLGTQIILRFACGGVEQQPSAIDSAFVVIEEEARKLIKGG